MPLSSIQTHIYDQTGLLTQDTVAVRRILGHINEGHRVVLGKKGMTRLRRALLTFASTADSVFVVLPQAVSKILAIADRTNNQILRPLSLPDLRVGDPGVSASSSNPFGYLIDNLAAALAIQPSNASELFFKSDSASDGATKEMFIQGIITGGHFRTASVAMNGVTAVSFGATLTAWIHVTKVFLALAAGGATTAAGNITIHEDSGAGTELGRILPGKTTPRYSRIHLYPQPTAVVTYHADVEVQVEDLAEAGDEPLIPADFHWLLEAWAIHRELMRKEKLVLAREELTRFNRGIADLRASIMSPMGPADDSQPRFSHLGPWFPAES